MTPSTSSFVSSIWQPSAFDGRVVFCTGGSGDICSAQVRALVYLGANACIVGRNQEKAVRVAKDIATVRPGSKVIGLGEVDVRNPEHLENAVSICVKELGGIDFLIAGAAGNFLAPVLQLSTNAFKAVVEIDLIGSWNAVKAAMPHLLKSASRQGSGGGRIIFVSSTTSYTGNQLVTHGVVAKAGVDALSAQLAIELGPRGITSNVIAPGAIADTEGTRRLIASEDAAGAHRKIPLGRLGSLKDIGDATVYLFSEAGGYVNGTILVVDGGAWRTGGASIGTGFEYPDFLLSNKQVTGVSGARKNKL